MRIIRSLRARRVAYAAGVSRMPAIACRLPAWATLALLLGACNGEVYLRDGVTDGDTFYLAERALHDTDPVLQSWVSYSLSRSACQLQQGEENPARATSFDCELEAREHLLETWSELRARNPAGSEYLDGLSRVQQAGYLDEYVWRHFRDDAWKPPPGLQPEHYEAWRRRHLPEHEPRTRWVGSWGYARRVSAEGFPE
jgi:hypothetical protein